MSMINKMSLIIFFGILFGMTGSFLVNQRNQNLVINKSAVNSKNPFSEKSFSKNSFGKLNRIMDAYIEQLSPMPENANQELTLRATFTLRKNLDREIHYRWILPVNTVVVSGHTDDVWRNMTANQTMESVITISGIDFKSKNLNKKSEDISDDKIIQFNVESEVDGQQIGTAGIFNSRIAMETNRIAAERSIASEKASANSIFEDKEKEAAKAFANGKGVHF